MDSAVCVRDSSADSPPSSSLVAPVAVKPLEGTQLMTHAAAAAVVEQQRLQQLYQFAIAERLRLASSLSWPRPAFEPTSNHAHLLSHPALNGPQSMLGGHSYMYPWRFVDPRALYRVPEEPKPQHSYIGLIAMAILSTPDKKLVLSDIYAYILDNYAYFRSRGPGWRNSIRHNLSLNDCFMKSGRSANGKGHYWAIHPANIDDFARGDFRRRRAQRRVRKHLGLQVDDDSSPEPPSASSPPPQINSSDIHHRLRVPTSLLSQPMQPSCRKRQFDVASLLAPDDAPSGDSILKSRKYGSPSRSNSPNLVPRNTAEAPLQENTISNGMLDEARHWPLLGWPHGHSWTILTPPQEDTESTEPRPSSSDH